jgi:hypothetical protein
MGAAAMALWKLELAIEPRVDAICSMSGAILGFSEFTSPGAV